MNADSSITQRIVDAEPITATGASGNKLERVRLDDGTRLICKQVSPEWDWISRATRDHGRALTMWQAGVFDRIPGSVDHTVVGVEPVSDQTWSIFMRDVSDSLVDPEASMDRAALLQVLGALADLHKEFWGDDIPGLCSLEDRYHLLSPATAQRETAAGHPVGETISRCWEAFRDFVPGDIADAIVALAHEPSRLAAELDQYDKTLVHGDVRFTNLGLIDDRITLVDWGERTGFAPAAVELVSFLMFDGPRMSVPLDEVVADFAALYGDRIDDRMMHLALIGGMVQLGPNPVLNYVLSGDQEDKLAGEHQLAWWIEKTSSALEVWSPL